MVEFAKIAPYWFLQPQFSLLWPRFNYQNATPVVQYKWNPNLANKQEHL